MTEIIESNDEFRKMKFELDAFGGKFENKGFANCMTYRMKGLIATRNETFQIYFPLCHYFLIKYIKVNSLILFLRKKMKIGYTTNLMYGCSVPTCRKRGK